MQPSNKTVAHYILKLLLQDSVKEFGSTHIMDEANILVLRKTQMHRFDEIKIRLAYIVENSYYSLKQVSDGVNLLAANKHIEIEPMQGEPFDQTLIKATPDGKKAFNEQYYKKKDYERLKIILAILTLVVAVATIAIKLRA